MMPSSPYPSDKVKPQYKQDETYTGWAHDGFWIA